MFLSSRPCTSTLYSTQQLASRSSLTGHRVITCLNFVFNFIILLFIFLWFTVSWVNPHPRSRSGVSPIMFVTRDDSTHKVMY